MIIVGGRIQSGIYGNWPDLTAAVDDDGNLPVTLDYRALLGKLVATL